MSRPQSISTSHDLKEILKKRAGILEHFLDTALPQGTPERLSRAMRYSLEAGGKRLRPVLCMTCGAICGIDEQKILPFAAAIEMIHTYSLIHDDLPAMDNDDLRRGKPSCHKAFDEATAILAGDGLLTDAFTLAASTPLESSSVLKALACLSSAAGSAGMVGGQMLDMQYTGAKNLTLAQIRHMQSLKTGVMIEASCACGALLANGSNADIEALSQYGRYLGRAFQVVDDILDIIGDPKIMGKPVGSDQDLGKNTCPAIIGVEKSRKLAEEDGQLAEEALSNYAGKDADFLRGLVTYILERSA